ncbi:hypothetical protein EDB83DRAFT_1150099 [Lactarius deliciosus]|nr:hypothetical protein EDB83DRAFT_481240 [Lactarius deliciosus]KAH9053954.1 hypothetical protein EDB83DRAFT_1150099 [Lactarius deliciosus]
MLQLECDMLCSTTGLGLLKMVSEKKNRGLVSQVGVIRSWVTEGVHGDAVTWQNGHSYSNRPRRLDFSQRRTIGGMIRRIPELDVLAARVGKNVWCHMVPCSVHRFGFWIEKHFPRVTLGDPFIGLDHAPWSDSSGVQLHRSYTKRTNRGLRCYQIYPMSPFRNFPKARVLSLVLFWCVAHYLNDLKAVSGVVPYHAHSSGVECRLTILT